MLFKNSIFYSFITDIPESTFRTPTFKINYNIPILAFCWINFTFPGSKCIHYVKDNKILNIKGSVSVSEALELRAGIAGNRAFSLGNEQLYWFRFNFWPDWEAKSGLWNGAVRLPFCPSASTISHVDRPWWVLPIVTFVCDLDLECSKFQGQIFYCV